MARKRFFRHFPRKGYPLYWILIAYLIVGYFYPVVGLLALICMIAPVSFAVKRGRWWCGNACPRGSLYDRVLSKYSPHRPIPEFVRTRGFRIFMVLFIFTMFGLQMYGAWGDWNAAGRVFWNIILATTIVGVILSFIYAPRTWCSFCPMGTLSAWVTPRSGRLPKNQMHDTMQTVFSRMPDAAQTVRQQKPCGRTAPPRLSEMRPMRRGMSAKSSGHDIREHKQSDVWSVTCRTHSHRKM